MKNKILNLIKSAVWFVLCLFVGALIFEAIRSLANSNEPAKKIGTTVFTEEGHDYLVVDTNMVFALFTQKVALVVKRSSV